MFPLYNYDNDDETIERCFFAIQKSAFQLAYDFSYFPFIAADLLVFFSLFFFFYNFAIVSVYAMFDLNTCEKTTTNDSQDSVVISDEYLQGLMWKKKKKKKFSDNFFKCMTSSVLYADPFNQINKFCFLQQSLYRRFTAFV